MVRTSPSQWDSIGPAPEQAGPVPTQWSSRDVLVASQVPPSTAQSTTLATPSAQVTAVSPRHSTPPVHGEPQRATFVVLMVQSSPASAQNDSRLGSETPRRSFRAATDNRSKS